MGKSVNGDIYGLDPSVAKGAHGEKIEIIGSMKANLWANFKKELKDVVDKYPGLTFSSKQFP